MSEVISVRVRREVKEVLERAGVDVAAEVRVFLEGLARRIKAEEDLKRFRKLLEEMPPAPRGFAARGVREDRDSL